MATICDIPNEIVLEYIVPGFLFKDVKNVQQFRMFNVTHNEMIDMFMNKDTILLNFSKMFDINIYDTLKNSSIDMTTFDQLISDFRNGITIQDTICFNMNNLNIDKINNTISIMKLFKIYSTETSYIGDVKEYLTNNLVRYMSEALVIRNKMSSSQVLSSEFISSLENTTWEYIGINLYEFFEKCHLVNLKPRCYNLKSSIEDILIVSNQQTSLMNPFTTIHLFINLVIFNEIRTKLYVIYELYRYLNYLERKSISSRVWTNHLKYIIFLKTGKLKAQEFMYQLQNQYANELPKYLSNLLAKELVEYINRQ